MKRQFTTTDMVLPSIELPNPCPIRIEIHKDNVLLYVGPRDWQWDFTTRKFIGCGTRVDPTVNPTIQHKEEEE